MKILVADDDRVSRLTLQGALQDWGYEVAKAEFRDRIVTEEEVGAGASRDGKILVNDRIADSIAKLPEREKLVIALYYYENLTLREIGEVLGVTESRVSQMHTKAVLRLRSRMQEESFDD